MLANPTLLLEEFDMATFRDVGKACDSGRDKFFNDNVVPPTELHASRVDG